MAKTISRINNGHMFSNLFYINTKVNNTSVDSATNISSSNMNQTGDNQESASYAEEHKNIGPNWNKLMMDAAINGVVSGVTVAAGPLISAGIGKVASFITTGLNNMGLSSIVDGLSSAARTAGNFVDDVANLSGISKITGALDDVTNSAAKSIDDGLSKIGVQQTKYYGINFGTKADLAKEFHSDLMKGGTAEMNSAAEQFGGKALRNPYIDKATNDNLFAGRFGKRPLEGRLGETGYKIKPDRIYHEQYIFDDGTNIGFGNKGMIVNENPTRYTVDMSSKYYDDDMMKQVIKDVEPGTYNWRCNNCQTYADRLKFVYEHRINNLK